MTFDMLVTVAGLVALFAGGEILLRGATLSARRLGMSELVIGLTIVGFGTSLPELLVSLKAALGNQPDIALGNVVGSNIANVLLIGAAAALVMPPQNWNPAIRRDGWIMVAASFLLAGVAFTGLVSPYWGILFVAGLAAYILFAFITGKAEQPEEAAVASGKFSGTPAILVMLGFGFALLFVGADWLIEGATAIARDFGVSEAAIGLTIVAVGTSLPELATSLMAAWRRQSDIALGNIVGSNIFNILGILGITAIITPITVSSDFSGFSVPVMLGVAVLLALCLTFLQKLGRLLAGMMLVAYTGYVWQLF